MVNSLLWVMQDSYHQPYETRIRVHHESRTTWIILTGQWMEALVASSTPALNKKTLQRSEALLVSWR